MNDRSFLGVGRHNYRYIDADDYLENIMKDHKKLEKYSRFAINLSVSHPIIPYRLKALMDIEKKDGKLI